MAMGAPFWFCHLSLCHGKQDKNEINLLNLSIETENPVPYIQQLLSIFAFQAPWSANSFAKSIPMTSAGLSSSISLDKNAS
jgi:hypothetical protein